MHARCKGMSGAVPQNQIRVMVTLHDTCLESVLIAMQRCKLCFCWHISSTTSWSATCRTTFKLPPEVCLADALYVHAHNAAAESAQEPSESIHPHHTQAELPTTSAPLRDVCITVKEGVYCQQPAGCACCVLGAPCTRAPCRKHNPPFLVCTSCFHATTRACPCRPVYMAFVDAPHPVDRLKDVNQAA